MQHHICHSLSIRRIHPEFPVTLGVMCDPDQWHRYIIVMAVTELECSVLFQYGWQEGQVSAVGIVTHYGLDGPGIESRWGARFSTPIQSGPGAHPASCTMGTESFLGVKWHGRGIDHPHSSSAEVKERVELYLFSPSGPSWPVLG